MLRKVQLFAAAAAVSVVLAACANAAEDLQENRWEADRLSGIVTMTQAEDWESGDDQSMQSDASSNAGMITGQHESVTADDLFQARTLYIGNASGTGILIQMVKSYFHIGEASTMELKTATPPYGLMLHFKKKPDLLAMQKASAVLIGLIDNCSSVSWDYPVDRDGNREACWVSQALTGQMLNEGRYVKEYAESADSVARLLSLMEGISEPLQPKARAASLDEAVSAAILEYSQSVYGENEASGEGHLILETQEKDDEVIVYALTMYGSYQFQDGNFVKNSGSGAIPAVITLEENPDGSLWWKWYQTPEDGSRYQDSIEALFPESVWEACSKPDSQQLKMLKQQEKSYAAAYLKTIGRQAEIGEYRDFSHPLLTEAGVSVEVSNKLSGCGRDDPDSPAAYAPGWIGNIERLENGVRYVYACDYDAEQQEIIYTKKEYAAGKIMEQVVFDAVSGDRKEM